MDGAMLPCDGTVIVLSDEWESGRRVARILGAMGLLPLLTSRKDGFAQVPNDPEIVGTVVVGERLNARELTVCREARQLFPAAFVVACTRTLEEQEELKALLHGVDQCLTDDTPEELFQARIRSLLDRLGAAREPLALGRDVRTIGGVEIDLSRHQLRILGAAVELTPTEMRLLEFISRTPGHAVSRSAIGFAVWGWDSDVYHEHLKCHVSNIRAKIRAVSSWELIDTVRGHGYCFRAPVELAHSIALTRELNTYDQNSVPRSRTNETASSVTGTTSNGQGVARTSLSATLPKNA